MSLAPLSGLNILLLDSAFEAHLRMQVFPSLTIRMKDPTAAADPNGDPKKKKKVMTFILPRGGVGVATGGQTTAGMLLAVQMLEAQILQHVIDTENSVRSASEYSAQHVSAQQAAALASMNHLGIQARVRGGRGKARYRTLSDDTIDTGKVQPPPLPPPALLQQTVQTVPSGWRSTRRPTTRSIQIGRAASLLPPPWQSWLSLPRPICVHASLIRPSSDRSSDVGCRLLIARAAARWPLPPSTTQTAALIRAPRRRR